MRNKIIGTGTTLFGSHGLILMGMYIGSKLFLDSELALSPVESLELIASAVVALVLVWHLGQLTKSINE
jgi:hypothetical protein